jgi:GDP-mannose transporter
MGDVKIVAPSEEEEKDVEMKPLVEAGGSDDEGEPEEGGAEGESKPWSLTSKDSVKAMSACGLYSFCSVSMIIVNKSLASSYNHHLDGSTLNILLVVFQAITAVMCVESSKNLKLIEEYPPLSWETVKAWAPLNIFFCLMLFTGMASLQTNSVPMVTVFKNITNIITSIGDYIFFENKTEPVAMAAFGIMLLGAILAAWHDTYMTPSGLFWMAANCMSTSCYILYMKYATESIKLTKFGMVYVNNVLW